MTETVDPDGIDLIAAERRRQIADEGYTPEHDAEHGGGELADAAVAYVGAALGRPEAAAASWPWGASSFWPGDNPVRMLVKAGALIAAEIDRRLIQAGNPDDFRAAYRRAAELPE